MRKQILALLLMACILLTGCRGSSEGPEPTDAPAAPPATEAPATEPAAAPTAAPTEAPTTAPTEAPTTAPTAAPTTAPTQPPAIVITKHPTSETVNVGAGTWFIASAENESQITWEIFSPDGTMYSVQEAMKANPGLVLEVLPKDTLGLRQIPASFSGWSARARYDGPAGTVTTDRAKITVRQDPYEDIINAYRAVYRSDSGHREKGVSELVGSWDYLGYAKADLDKNGVDELILASNENNELGRVVYGVYTMNGGKAVNLATSRARERYYLMKDGCLLMEGSNSATEQVWVVYRLNGTSLTMDEEIYTSDTPHDLEGSAPYYYYSSGYENYAPMYTSDAEDQIQFWKNAFWMPSLNGIS